MIRSSLIRYALVFINIAFRLTMAQTTQTLADPNVAGGLIVEVVTTDINGLQVTQIVSSVPPGGALTTTNVLGIPTTAPIAITTSTTKTRTPVTAVPVVQGPVGQPAPTIPPGEGQTLYTYTTTNQLGETTILSDVFTPTYNTPSPPSSPSVGTVLDLSAWSALIGTNTAGGPTNGAVGWPITWSGVKGLLALGCGVIAGAWTVL